MSEIQFSQTVQADQEWRDEAGMTTKDRDELMREWETEVYGDQEFNNWRDTKKGN